MISLGDALELLHSSRGFLRTARVVGRTDDSIWRFWWAGNDRFRFEREREGSGFINVRNGRTWWILDSDGRASSNHGDPELGLGMQPELGLLHTRSLLAAAILEVLREEMVAGRRAAILRATPRPAAGHWRWWGFWNASESMEIPLDLERGVALGGNGSRVEEVVFDEEFSAEVFAQPYGDAHPVEHTNGPPREVALDEARRAAPFQIMVPRLLPEGARLVKCLLDPAKPPQWVGLSWALDHGHRYTLRLRQGPAVAAAAETAGGEEIVEQGVQLRFEGAGAQLPQTVFVETGTRWYEIDSDLPREALIEIARSLGEPR